MGDQGPHIRVGWPFEGVVYVGDPGSPYSHLAVGSPL